MPVAIGKGRARRNEALPLNSVRGSAPRRWTTMSRICAQSWGSRSACSAPSSECPKIGQKWESGAAWPHRQQLEKLVKLAAAVTRAPLSAVEADMLTVRAAAGVSGITQKTICKALKDGRLEYTVDTSPGPWLKQGRYLIRRADVAFKANGYDPYFRKGRFKGTNEAAPQTD
jgi:hypothetical protein